MSPRIRVVGLGPGSPDALTLGAASAIESAAVARLRTRRHPAAERFAAVPSYDEWYERADSFDELYAAIVEDLVALAVGSPDGEVVYAVPGSPVVAERTVELLRDRPDVELVVEPAVSVIDLACAAVGVDPMAVGLRVVDALSPIEWREGPHLVLQCYAPEVLAVLSDSLEGSRVTVLHHLGLDSARVEEVEPARLASVDDVDHLTSLWVEVPRGPGEAAADLVALVHRLRAECPWDREQTHASLAPHLLEEAYEALDAIDEYVADDSDAACAHVVEELGDLWCQILLHAELAHEEDRFDLTGIADTLAAKLVARHPHVFGDASAATAEEVAARWEVIKRVEKGRASVTDGVVWQLPSLMLYSKLLRGAASLGLAPADPVAQRDAALEAVASLAVDPVETNDGVAPDAGPAWGDALVALCVLARHAGVDLEGVLRERARHLRDDVVTAENALG